MSEGDNGETTIKELFQHPQEVDLDDGEASGQDAGPPDYDGPDYGADDDGRPEPPPHEDDGRGGDSGPPPDDPGGPSQEELRDGAYLDNNDLGNGQRVLRYFGEDLRFVPSMGWHVWDGRRWELDLTDAKMRVSLKARRRIHELPDMIKREADAIIMRREERELCERADRNKAEWRRLDAMTLKELDDAPELAERLEELTEEQMQAKLCRAELTKVRQTHRKYAISTGNSAKLGNALIEAAPYLQTPVEYLDRKALTINCENVTLDFVTHPAGDEPGEEAFAEVVVRQHDRKDLITKMMNVTYDPDARCPAFDAFLKQMQPDPEVRAFLARWHAYGLLGHQDEQKLVFYYGEGANGKSTLTALIEKMMGDYATSMAIEAITGTDERRAADATPDLVKLPGARYVNVVEPKEGAQLKEDMVKKLTGGDVFRARFMQQEFFEFFLRATITISGNHKPVIRGGDWGIWRRIMLLKWGVIIPEDQRDKSLPDQLFAEAPGVLNWLLDGWRDYAINGLCPPKAVTDATAEYRGDSDFAGDFISRCCIITGDAADVVKAKDLNAAFNYFLSENGQPRWGARALSNALSKKAQQARGTDGQQFVHDRKAAGMVYIGIRFARAFTDEYDPHDPQQNPPEPRGR